MALDMEIELRPHAEAETSSLPSGTVLQVPEDLDLIESRAADAPPLQDAENSWTVRPPPVENDTASARSGKKAKRRVERAQRREANERANIRELKALLEVLRALPRAVPGISSAASNGSPSKDAASVRATGASFADELRLEPSHIAAGGACAAPIRPESAEVKAALAEAEIEASLQAAEAVLRTERPYRDLPAAFGPCEGVEILRTMLDRPPKYQEKYLAQELSLLAKIWALAGCGDTALAVEGENAGMDTAANSCADLAIIDIGAGNGCLALLAAVLLGGHAVLIDHTLPPETLRVEDKVPEPWRSRVLRITGDIADVDPLQDLEPLLERHGLRRAVLLAKHLCGLGTDLAIGFVRRWQQGNGGTVSKVNLVGAAFATCCGHKIGAGDRAAFGDLHAKDPYLEGLTGKNPTCLLELLALSTRCVAWRTTAGASASRIMSSQVRAAELFEDLLQQPRLNMLRRLFPAATEVIFVPAAQSPQNRCLLAGSSLALRCAECPGEAFMVALRAAQEELLAAVGGPLDLKPRGFVSSKYDYDGT